MIKRRYSFSILITIAVTILFGFLHPVSALSAGGVGGYPAYPDPDVPYSESWFIYDLDLGESKDDELILFNNSDEPQVVKIYAVDSIPSNQGNFALAAEDAPKKGVGAWVDLTESILTVDPGVEYRVPFTITVPENADVGEHSGGIVLQKVGAAAEYESNQGAAGATIVTRVGIRIYETVPGEIIRDIKIEDFSVDEVAKDDGTMHYAINLHVSNNSNVSLRPQSELIIGGWGKTVWFPNSRFKNGMVIDFNDLTDFFTGETFSKEWQLLRDQKVSTNWEWPVPVFGKYTFKVDLTYDTDDGPKTISTDTITKWVVPWLILGIIGGFVLLIIVLIVFFKMRRKGRKWKKYTVKKGDQLVMIAEQSKVSWKRLAKVNKLKSPVIREGETILVPPSYESGKSSKVTEQKTTKKTETKTTVKTSLKSRKK